MQHRKTSFVRVRDHRSRGRRRPSTTARAPRRTDEATKARSRVRRPVSPAELQTCRKRVAMPDCAHRGLKRANRASEGSLGWRDPPYCSGPATTSSFTSPHCACRIAIANEPTYPPQARRRPQISPPRAHNPRAPGRARMPHNNGRCGGDQAWLPGMSHRIRCLAHSDGRVGRQQPTDALERSACSGGARKGRQ